jgi:hypothetical protein
MKILKVMLTTLLSTIGGAFLVLGELDDSPGLGGIGLIFIGISIYLNLKEK